MSTQNSLVDVIYKLYDAKEEIPSEIISRLSRNASAIGAKNDDLIVFAMAAMDKTVRDAVSDAFNEISPVMSKNTRNAVKNEIGDAYLLAMQEACSHKKIFLGDLQEMVHHELSRVRAKLGMLWIAICAFICCVVLYLSISLGVTIGEKSGFSKAIDENLVIQRDLLWKENPEVMRAMQIPPEVFKQIVDCTWEGWTKTDGVCYPTVSPQSRQKGVPGWKITE